MILLGVVFLGERLTRIQATGAALAISGVLLVSI
jgi:drug/metabolite transporter (DMT)-like permease